MYYEEHGEGPPLVLLHGDIQGIPRSRLSILPGTGQATLPARAEWIVPMVVDFLEAE